ncbi:MAG: type II secretion system protein [Anaerohalosphaeraceae bacterium]
MKSVVQKHSAFTLVELMIVVAVIGILAALVFPEVQGYSQRAKEAAAKDNLRIFREAIERYALDHNGIPPGYPDDDTSKTPTYPTLYSQLIIKNKYLKRLPKNPFNNYTNILVFSNDNPIDPNAQYPPTVGWLYHPYTKTLKINQQGFDTHGEKYYNY